MLIESYLVEFEPETFFEALWDGSGEGLKKAFAEATGEKFESKQALKDAVLKYIFLYGLVNFNENIIKNIPENLQNTEKAIAFRKKAVETFNENLQVLKQLKNSIDENGVDTTLEMFSNMETANETKEKMIEIIKQLNKIKK